MKIHPSATIESNQIDSNSFVCNNCKIKEKTSIKNSIIGEGCVINPKTRISRCILFKNVEIQEG